MRLLPLLLLAALAGCSEDDDPPPPLDDRIATTTETFSCPTVDAAPDDVVVLVRDQNFDLDDEVFRGRLNGCYTIRCDDSADSGPAPASADEARRALIESLGQKDERCRLEPGVRLVRNRRLDDVTPQGRASWNDALRSKKAPSVAGSSELAKLVSGSDGFVYHGTATAGLIAEANPKVRLVIVADEGLHDPGDKVTCPSPESISQTLDLYDDPEVHQAIVDASTSRLTDELLGVIRAHGVTVNNESFGPLSRASIEDACPGPWERYFTTEAKLNAERQQRLDERGVFDGINLLTLRSAGNESLLVDSTADSLFCGRHQLPDEWGPGSETLVVGALESGSWAFSEFSNHGDCVDLYAPGHKILTWAPQDLLTVLSGTSFSAPLVAALAASIPSPTAAGRRAALEARLDDERRLPRGDFSDALQFDAPTAAPMLLPPQPRRLAPSLRSPRWRR